MRLLFHAYTKDRVTTHERVPSSSSLAKADGIIGGGTAIMMVALPRKARRVLLQEAATRSGIGRFGMSMTSVRGMKFGANVNNTTHETNRKYGSSF